MVGRHGRPVSRDSRGSANGAAHVAGMGMRSMVGSRAWVAAWVMVGVCAHAPSAGAEGRSGLYGGFALGIGEGNFSIDSADSDADIGIHLDASVGYAWNVGPGALGAAAGFSVTSFAYEVQVLGTSVADLSLSFTTLDLLAHYFLPVSDNLEVPLRVGISRTKGTVEFESADEEEESTGFVVSGGIGWFAWESGSLIAEIYYRTYGLAFAATKDEEVSVAGLVLGARWR